MELKIISQTFEIAFRGVFSHYKTLVLTMLKLLIACRLPNFIVKI